MTTSEGVNRQTRKPCLLHHKHMPQPHLNHIHHVWPLGAGGPDTPDNEIVVCPTGHYNIHELLKQYIAYRGEVPYTVIRTFSFEEREYARIGWERITRRSMQ